MREQLLTAADGTRVPLDWFPADDPRGAILFMPALGIQARMYRALAESLSSAGWAVALLEQRGHGRSPIRARRGSDWGMAEFLEQDIPATLDWMQHAVRDRPIVIGGHSLGAHLATLFAGFRPERCAGVIHVAAGAPYHRDFSPRWAWLIRLLCLLVSLSRVAPGYFPGHRIGFAGRESLGLMRDWRDWALTGRLDFGGRTDRHDAVARYTGPVLSIALEHDDYATPAAIDRALAPFVNAPVTRITLGAAAQGEYLGHFRWARNPAGVAQALIDWLAGNVATDLQP